MKYQYNFSFLNEWLNANPKIPKGAIQQALGAKSNNRFKAWARREGPMPVISIPQFGITECLIQYKCSVNTPPPHAIRSG